MGAPATEAGARFGHAIWALHCTDRSCFRPREMHWWVDGPKERRAAVDLVGGRKGKGKEKSGREKVREERKKRKEKYLTRVFGFSKHEFRPFSNFRIKSSFLRILCQSFIS